MTQILQSRIASLLRPGLKAVFDPAVEMPAYWSQVFEKENSDKDFEIVTETSLLPIGRLKEEGASVTYGGMGQTNQTIIKNKRFGIGFIITYEAMKNNLYKTQFPKQAKALKISLDQGKEINCANIFNNAFDSAYTIGDGQALCSVNHPLSNGGVQANTFSTQVDLSEAALEQALTAISLFKTGEGTITNTQPKKLVVHPSNKWTASRLLNSQFRTGTANNDINAIYNSDAIPGGYLSNPYLTNTKAWFIVTDAPEGFKYYEREARVTGVYDDFDTDNIKVKAIDYYGISNNNHRSVFGSSGSL